MFEVVFGAIKTTEKTGVSSIPRGHRLSDSRPKERTFREEIQTSHQVPSLQTGRTQWVTWYS